MSDLDRIVDVAITIESAALSVAGFGRPLILATVVPADFTERYRLYTDPSGMLDDGFLAGNAAYIEALSLMSQRPRPSSFLIGRRATAVAQVDTIVVTAPADTTTYGLTLNGVAFSDLTDSDATATETRDVLVAAINASTDVRIIGITAAAVSTDTLTLTANQAGIPFTTTIDAGDEAVLVLTNTTASVGIPEDLTAISAAITDPEQDWYALLIAQRDRDTIMTVAPIIEAQRKMFFAQSNDAAILSAAYDSGSPRADVASELKAGSYTRTSLIFNDSDAEAAASAWVGRCISATPAAITWMFKELAGITAKKFTDTEYANLLSKNANGYMPMAGRSMTFKGTVGSGEFIDIIRGVDKLYSRIQENVFGALIKLPKVPFTARGLQVPAAGIRNALNEAVRDGLIADSRTTTDGDVESPAYTLTVPAIEDIPASDRANRRIPESNPYSFEGTLAGAVHLVTVRGTVSV